MAARSRPQPRRTWSTALLTTLHDSTGSGAGGIDWTFSIQDKDLDFLAAGETLTVTYDVTVIDGSGATSTQQVTITATGAEDTLLVNPLTASLTDTAGTDEGFIVGSGNLIIDAGDSPGDGANVLTVTEVNGQPVAGTVDIAGAYGTLTVSSSGDLRLRCECSPRSAAGRRQPDRGVQLHGERFLRPQRADHGDLQRHRSERCAAHHRSRHAWLDDGGRRPDRRRQWQLRDRRPHRLDRELSVSVDFVGIGGEFGNYAARLSGSGFLEQNVATTAGQHYTLSFSVAGDSEASATSFNVYWDGAQILSQVNVAPGFHTYTFDVVGDALDPTTQLFFDFSG